MAYDEALAIRVISLLDQSGVQYTEKKMFGGIAYMIQDKMCIGITKEKLMLRVLDEEYETMLKEAFVKPMDFNGRVMKSFLFIEPQGYKTATQLKRWVNAGLQFGEKGVVKSKQKKNV